MFRRSPLLVFLLLALPVAAAGGSAPSVSVAADGTTVAGGETYVTRDDPTLSIGASVPPEAPNGTRIDVVAVHLDGAPHETFDVNDTSVTRTVSPTFHYADNEIKVIVTDTNDEVATTRFTVQKDPRAPWVNLSEPYHSPPGALVPDASVNRSYVNVTGDVQELNRVREIRLTYDHENSSHHGSIDVELRGRSFSERLLLGEGTNTVRIFTRDDLDNRQQYEFEITVNDTDAPSLDLQSPANLTNTSSLTTNASTLTLDGTVADAVWVEGATVTVDANATNASETTTLVPDRAYEPSTDRLSASFEREVDLEAGENDVTITATDAFGHNTTTSFSVTYDEPETVYRLPSVRLDRNRTRFVGERSLRIDGRATGLNLTHVAVEATADGETVGYTLVHDGAPRPAVDLDATVATGGNVTKVVVRAVDDRGGLRERIVYANAATNATFVGRDGEADGAARRTAPRTVVRTVAREPTTVVETAAPTPTPAVSTVVHTRTHTRTHIERRTVTVTPNASGGPLGAVDGVVPAVPSLGLLPIAGVATALVVGIGLLVGARYRREAAAAEE